MNAAFLLMSSAALAGADPAPAAPAAPAVISTGHGCNDCGAPAGCAPKAGLLDKIKARLGGLKNKSHDCGCAPAPVAHCDTCPKSVADRPNLLDKLKARLGSKKTCGCAPACDPCGGTVHSAAHPTVPAHPTMTPPGTGQMVPPKEMPKPKEPAKDAPKPKSEARGIPTPLPPITGAAGTSPY